jgi:hypothetical protein
VKLRNILRPREKFLILEISAKGTNGVFLSVDEDRNIIFERSVRNVDLEKFLKSAARSVAQKSWEGKYFFKSRRHMIVAADPTVATTIPIPLELSREPANAKVKLNIAELENLIAQAMAKIFNGCRSEAAKRLQVNELDGVLVGAKTKYFKIDGKAVVSPAGFPGKKISLLLELTFTTREVFENLKPFFNSSDDFFFAESPQAQLFSISRVRKLPLNLIVMRDEGASLYVLQKAKDEYAVLYRETLDWSLSSIFKGIMEAFAVTEKTAKEIYRGYQRHELSQAAERAFKKTLQPAITAFLEEIEKAGVRGSAYIDSPHPLPLTLPHHHGAAHLEEHPINEVLAHLGFTTDLTALGDKRNDAIRPLLCFLEAYFDRSNSDINQKLRRRLHWLAG